MITDWPQTERALTSLQTIKSIGYLQINKQNITGIRKLKYIFAASLFIAILNDHLTQQPAMLGLLLQLEQFDIKCVIVEI